MQTDSGIDLDTPPQFIGLPITIRPNSRVEPVLTHAYVRAASITAIIPHGSGHDKRCCVFTAGDSNPFTVEASAKTVMQAVGQRA